MSESSTVIRWSTRERAFVAKAPGLSSCIGTGDSYQTALNSCLEAMQWQAEQAEQRRQPLPPAEVSWSHRTAAEETKHSTVL
jgi:predicted RNase H-like HicB family nuclease